MTEGEKKMGKIEIKGKSVIFRRKDEITVIEPYGKNCLRCRSTRNSKVSEESWTLLPPVTEDCCVIEGDEKAVTITNGQVSATLEAGSPWYGGIITYYRDGKKILHTKYEGDYVNKYVHTEGDHYHCL